MHTLKFPRTLCFELLSIIIRYDICNYQLTVITRNTGATQHGLLLEASVRSVNSGTQFKANGSRNSKVHFKIS